MRADVCRAFKVKTEVVSDPYVGVKYVAPFLLMCRSEDGLGVDLDADESLSPYVFVLTRGCLRLC